MPKKLDQFYIDEQKEYRKAQVMYAISRVMKGVVYVIKIILSLLVEVVKSLLVAFKIPIPKV